MLNLLLEIYHIIKEKKTLVYFIIIFNKLIIDRIKSKFCGNCICNTHGKYRHANPEDNSKFSRCCDLCHYKFLKAAIEADFKFKMNLKTIELNKKK